MCGRGRLPCFYRDEREREGGCALLCCDSAEPAPSRTLLPRLAGNYIAGKRTFFFSRRCDGPTSGAFLTEMPLVQTAVVDGGLMFFLGSWDRDCGSGAGNWIFVFECLSKADEFSRFYFQGEDEFRPVSANFVMDLTRFFFSNKFDKA